MRVRLFCPQQICIPQTSRAVSLLSLSTRGACAQQCSLRCEARGEVRAHAWYARTSGVGGLGCVPGGASLQVDAVEREMDVDAETRMLVSKRFSMNEEVPQEQHTRH